MQIKYIIIKIGQAILNMIYFFFKLCRTQKKVLFMSRQTNNKNLDFDMIVEELETTKPEFKIVVLNKRLEAGVVGKVKYMFHMIKQMYHMANSKVIVLDSYSILTSILKQKKGTKILQLWHALGSLKKFGHSILGQKEGRDGKTAKVMKMHQNYDYIITSSEISKKYFMEAFDSEEEKMIVLGLPRIDFLQSEKASKEAKTSFYAIYNECDNGKKNILYAPTLRQNKNIKIDEVIKSVDYGKYNLIIKMHSGEEIIYVNNEKIEKGEYFIGLELLHVADYIITDYSAIVYEASLVKKPIYFYSYDIDDYMKDRGVYIDYRKEMPGFISEDIKEIMNKIANNKFDINSIEEFTKKYIECKDMDITKKLVEIITKLSEDGKL